MNKKESIPSVDIQKKRQLALDQVFNLLDTRDIKDYKEWLMRIACSAISVAEDRDSLPAALMGDFAFYSENIWILWQFFDFLEDYDIDLEEMRQIFGQ